MHSDDLVPILTPPTDRGLRFRQGVVVFWDPATGNNIVDVGGSSLVDLPALSTGAATLVAGDVVGLLTWQSSWFILGKITAPAP